MEKRFFIKMNRVENGLERVIEAVRRENCRIEEMTARRSLDNAFFFVRMAVEGGQSAEHLQRELAALEEIREVEVHR